MKFVFFVQSIISDWNHGNAHFLRGVVTELIRRGHEVKIFEPSNSWSLLNLIKTQGQQSLDCYYQFFPQIHSIRYQINLLDLSKELDGADVVIVHEWNEHELVKKIGEHRKLNSYLLFFHDTHHRALTDPHSMSLYDLSGYDGVLAFGKILRDTYIKNCWIQRAWVWHEAADTWVFRPVENSQKKNGLVWVGNWGDEERSKELHEFLFNPVHELKLKTSVFGVRYPQYAMDILSAYGIDYGGWVANYRVPQVFSKFSLTVHIPRRPYATALPGIPTIRPFEALSCGIPLICSPWDDSEGLFSEGRDYLVARNGKEMKEKMRAVINDLELVSELTRHGRETILARHTCRHRVDQLLSICKEYEVGRCKALLQSDNL